MKLLVISIILLLSSGISAQETEKGNLYSSKLQIGELLNFGNRSLKFKKVVSDSRCPKDVTCIWAGEAVVSIEVYENGKCLEEKLIVISTPDIPLKFSSDNLIYSISGMVLSPIPTVNKKMVNEDYKLYLSVEESIKI